jgi:hypothetical protein
MGHNMLAEQIRPILIERFYCMFNTQCKMKAFVHVPEGVVIHKWNTIFIYFLQAASILPT